jgi:NAD-dependent dihydropyrimidine dehydrogenase PreA subunit
MKTETTNMTEIEVFRFDPRKERKPHYETYKVPLGGTVLDALKYIYEEHDASLSFRFGCSGPTFERCGACAVKVNGEPALGCKKILSDHMKIEPHHKYVILKDLVVDFDRENSEAGEWDAPSTEVVVDPEKCTACNDCVLICPLQVLTVKKVNGKGRAVAADPESCCGKTCAQCVTFCPNGAIHLQGRGEVR